MASALLAALLFMFPASAAAERDCDGPTGDQYCPKTEVLTAGGTGGDPSDSGSDADALPFTGFDLALSIAAGAGLLGAGLALRRAASSRGASG